MRFGEIWLVDFDPAIGDEIRKRRPAIVINLPQPALGLRIVVPLTEWRPRFSSVPWMIRVEPSSSTGLAKTSAADVFQLQSVSVDRFVLHIGAADRLTMAGIAVAVRLIL